MNGHAYIYVHAEVQTHVYFYFDLLFLCYIFDVGSLYFCSSSLLHEYLQIPRVLTLQGTVFWFPTTN